MSARFAFLIMKRQNLRSFPFMLSLLVVSPPPSLSLSSIKLTKSHTSAELVAVGRCLCAAHPSPFMLYLFSPSLRVVFSCFSAIKLLNALIQKRNPMYKTCRKLILLSRRFLFPTFDQSVQQKRRRHFLW